MNKGLIGVIFFAGGTYLGFKFAKLLLKEKYEREAQAEIDSVKATFREIRENEFKPQNESKRFADLKHELGYSEEEKPAPTLLPRVIPPEDFGTLDYEQVSLTYYSDGVLADDDDHAMDDDEIEESVGKESLTHFGEYEDDSVYVRNDRVKVDYEILSDPRSYKDILNERSYPAADPD